MKELPVLFLVTLLAAPGRDRPCDKQDTKLVEGLMDRMRWTAYWEDMLHDGARSPGKLLFIWNDELAGYCSSGLQSCDAFERQPGGNPGQSLGSTEIRPSEPLQEAMAAFILDLTRRPGMKLTVPLGVAPPQDGTYLDAAGNTIKVPFSNGGTGPRSGANRAHAANTCTLEVPAAIAPPRAVAQKIVSPRAKSLAQTLIGLLKYGSQVRNEKGSAFVIPYFGEDDPVVYVLRCASGSDLEVLAMGWRQSRWAVVSHGDGQFNKPGFEWLCRKIRATAMTTVRND